MTGRVWKFGDNVDTDVITPTEYLHSKKAYVEHAFEPVEPSFAAESEPGDVIVAGENFGMGSSRETAPIAIQENGIEAVVAGSFARIFYRNAINIGLPVYICPEATAAVETDHEIEVDHEESRIHNRSLDETYEAEPHPPFIQDIIDAGGLRDYHQRISGE